MARSGPETKLVNQILGRIRSLDCPSWARKVHGSIYADAGEPDIDAVIAGVPLKLEAKVPGRDATPAQAASLRRWERAGAVVGVVHDVGELEERIQECRRRAGLRP